jgi:hypothetical protein
MAGGAFASAQAQVLLGWKAHLEGNATLFFGATSQQLLAGATALSHADSAFQATVAARFRYGVTGDTLGHHTVTARAWFTSLTLDVRPFDRFSPFVLGSAESSLEQGVRRRLNGGAGLKWTPTRGERQEASLSLALLGERTQPITDSLPTTSRVRWSARVKGFRRIGDRLKVTHVTYYQPLVENFGNFVLTTKTDLAYHVMRHLELLLTLNDEYDSAARSRGARSDNSGQLLFGMQSDF